MKLQINLTTHTRLSPSHSRHRSELSHVGLFNCRFWYLTIELSTSKANQRLSKVALLKDLFQEIGSRLLEEVLVSLFEGPDAGELQSFIWKILVPLIKLVHAHECKILNETADSFFDVVIETNSWGIVEATMVPFFIRSVGLSMGLLQNKELDIYAWDVCSFFCSNSSNTIDSDMNKGAIISGSGSFPLYTVCHILTSILEAAVRSQSAGGISKFILTSGTLGENLLWDLCNMTVRMLSQSVEHRSCAIKLLLPVIFRVFVSHSAIEMSFHGQTYDFQEAVLEESMDMLQNAIFSGIFGEKRFIQYPIFIRVFYLYN